MRGPWRDAMAILATGITVAGCIPRADPPYRSRPAPDARSTATPRYRHAPPPDDQRDRPRDDEDRNAAADRPDAQGVSTLPAARPAWEARPVAADAAMVAQASYTVQPGDTIGRIADRTGAGVDAIARANAIEPPYPVHVGQRLKIPAGRYHLVRPGQTGIAIARAYAVEWSRIVAANDLQDPYTLRVGQRVLIPGTAPGQPAPTRAERASAFRLDIDDILTGGEPALARNETPVRPAPTATRVLPPTAAVVAPARLTGGFLWPVDGHVVKRFGPGASGERNDGIEIAVPVATPVRATADGVVAYVGDGIAALGGLVIVKHGDGWTSVYGHASKLLVQRGQSVKRGQTIALSGDTGFADRPEAHFELRKGRTPVDPLGQLPQT
ncbi:M23 family metallopeptidase [Sphingomonas bacterium]|uniref:M23 family metallopeptidase n=1 Tax=Sphingomonas bacterium TaxID=1895847 RepID=UPI0020C73535|nr:M23 family metallopeptidase [Sphingomonas bacterium]